MGEGKSLARETHLEAAGPCSGETRDLDGGSCWKIRKHQPSEMSEGKGTLRPWVT